MRVMPGNGEAVVQMNMEFLQSTDYHYPERLFAEILGLYFSWIEDVKKNKYYDCAWEWPQNKLGNGNNAEG